MVIAIDGPSGVGKSTIAKYLSDFLDIYYLNSGAFYRVIANKAISENVSLDDEESIINLAQKIEFLVEDRQLYADSKQVDYKALQSEDIALAASKISRIVKVREAVSKAIYAIVENNSLVAEGRDMTTVVFPDAQFKFYLDANAQVRAKRRFNQENGGSTYEEILQEMHKRDENDRNKEVGSLKIAKTAHYIDTSLLTTSQVYEKMLKVIFAKNKKGSGEKIS